MFNGGVLCLCQQLAKGKTCTDAMHLVLRRDASRRYGRAERAKKAGVLLRFQFASEKPPGVAGEWVAHCGCE